MIPSTASPALVRRGCAPLSGSDTPTLPTGVPDSGDPTHLRRQDWRVDSIEDHGIVVRIIRAWHYAQGAPNTSTYRHGLYRAKFELGDPYGVALWLPPTGTAAKHIAGDDWRGVLALSRLVIEPGMPTNAASFLLGGSMRLIDRHRWPVLLTYADTRLGHTGAIYKATNWRCDGEVKAGDLWLDDRGRQTSRKHGRFTFTAAQMIERGYHRAEPSPKIRFVHDVRRPLLASTPAGSTCPVGVVPCADRSEQTPTTATTAVTTVCATQPRRVARPAHST